MTSSYRFSNAVSQTIGWKSVRIDSAPKIRNSSQISDIAASPLTGLKFSNGRSSSLIQFPSTTTRVADALRIKKEHNITAAVIPPLVYLMNTARDRWRVNTFHTTFCVPCALLVVLHCRNNRGIKTQKISHVWILGSFFSWEKTNRRIRAWAYPHLAMYPR